MYKNSILQLFSKSDRVTGLSAKRRVQRVPDSSNSGSDLLKNNGFVYKWKLLTAFLVHCNRLSICLGFIIVSPLENYNTEHILLEVLLLSWIFWAMKWWQQLKSFPAKALQPLHPNKLRWCCKALAGGEQRTAFSWAQFKKRSHTLEQARSNTRVPWNNGYFFFASFRHLSFLLYLFFFPFPC